MTPQEVIKNLKKLKSFHNGSYGTAINIAIKALESTGWIPVNERLPEDFGGDYLVNIEYKGEHEGIDIATYVMGGYLDGLWDTPNDWIEGPSELWHVTAWMPLPEPYKEEKK